MDSYKPCTHPHPPTLTHTQPKKSHTHPHPLTPSQKMVTLTHTHPQPAKKRSQSPTPTHTQHKRGHNHPHPPTRSQEKVTTTHTQPKKRHTHPNSAVNVGKRKFFVIHQVIKFVRNSRSHQHQQINRNQYFKGRNFGRRKFSWNRFSRLTLPNTASLAE